MFRFLKNNAGYGLITTIISICVLSTITISSMTLLTSMMSSLEFFRANVVAQTLAISKVNLLSVAKYDSVVNEARAQVDSTYKLDREIVVNEVDLGGSTKEKDITINIYKSGAADKLFTMNYTLASAGSGSATPHDKQLFTSSGIFTVPLGVTKVWVSGSGGGGGGGAGYYDVDYNEYSFGSGGGGAACAYLTPITGLTGNQTISITIGAGGAPSASGETTSFGSYITLPGGGPGQAATIDNPVPSIGGTSGGFGGEVGTNASSGFSSTAADPGLHRGGNTLFGYGGRSDVQNPTGYGSGGGGGGTSGVGQSGASGFILVEW